MSSKLSWKVQKCLKRMKLRAHKQTTINGEYWNEETSQLKYSNVSIVSFENIWHKQHLTFVPEMVQALPRWLKGNATLIGLINNGCQHQWNVYIYIYIETITGFNYSSMFEMLLTPSIFFFGWLNLQLHTAFINMIQSGYVMWCVGVCNSRVPTYWPISYILGRHDQQNVIVCCYCCVAHWFGSICEFETIYHKWVPLRPMYGAVVN